MARGRMTKNEYRNKSNSHYGNGSRAKPDCKRPYQQRGYNFQRTKLLSRNKTSKLIKFVRGA